MKILLAHSYYRERGGEDAVFEQEHAMFEKAGHQVRAVTLRNQAASAWPKWKQLLCLFWNPWAYHEVRRLCLEFRPDILHVHNLFPFLSPSVIVAARRCGVRVVMTLHNYRLSCANGLFLRNGRRCMQCAGLAFGWPSLRYRCYRGSLPMTLAVTAANTLHRHFGIWRQVSRFIAPSRFTADKLRAATGLAVGVKPHCVSGQWAPPAEEQKSPYALFVGRFAEEKGITLLLDAWQRVRPAGGFTLHLAGEGPVAIPEAPGVVTHGRLAMESLKPLMTKAAFVVVPSLCYETMSRVVMEAYAAGTAVLAPSDSAPGSLVQEGVTGTLFASGNPEALAEAMQYLIDHPDAAAQMGRAAYAEYRRDYTEEAGSKNLLSLYEAVCSGS